MKEPYVGQTPIVSGEIAEDITHYYAVSEQTPTVCALGVLVNTDLTVISAGGYLIQLLPGVDDATIDRLEANINKLPPVSKMLANGMTPEEICKMAEDRIAAKKAKDYAKADEIREQIKALGYVLIDTKDGTKIEKA